MRTVLFTLVVGAAVAACSFYREDESTLSVHGPDPGSCGDGLDGGLAPDGGLCGDEPADGGVFDWDGGSGGSGWDGGGGGSG